VQHFGNYSGTRIKMVAAEMVPVVTERTVFEERRSGDNGSRGFPGGV
jgi:hypothetical protein